MKRMSRVAAAMVFLAVVYGGGTSMAVAASAKPRVVKAVRAGRPPLVDGKLNDACWKKAEPITGFVKLGATQPARWQTFGYVCYDDSHLYIGLKCLMPEGTEPVGQMRPHDSDVFHDDVVEIMLDPGRTRSDYYQLAVNAYGATFDCSRRHGGADEDDAWNGEWEAKSHIGDGYWSTELAIPYYNLGITPRTGSIWGLNLCRTTLEPRELSAMAAGGAFNEARAFAALTGLNADFGNYFFKIGPAFTIFDPTTRKPRAILNMPVANMTSKARKVKIHIERVTAEGSRKLESKAHTFSGKQSVVLQLEPVELEPVVRGRTNVHVIRGKLRAKKIVVADAETGAVLSLTAVKAPSICEAMRLEVADPWQRDTPAMGTSEVRLKVYTFLLKEFLEKGELALTLTSPRTGEVVITRKTRSPSRTLEVTIPAARLSWGAYDVRAAFTDSNGREVVAASALATVLPGGKQRIKVLNNFVSELMNAKERGLLAEREIDFMNPREGWCFFAYSGDVTVTLDDKDEPLAVPRAGGKPVEAMRYLSAGRHTLHVAREGRGSPSSLIVRAIPELQYASIDMATPKFKEYGTYDWDYLERIGMLANLNVFVARLLKPETPERLLNRWTAQGKRIIQDIGVPGIAIGGRAEQSYDYWVRQHGMVHPKVAGLIANEFMGYEPALSGYPHYVAAVERLLAEKKDRLFYLYLSAYGGPEPMMRLVRPLVEQGRCRFASERYFHEMPTEERAQGYLKSVLSEHFQSFSKNVPGIARKMIWVTGMLCGPPESVNINPLVSFKVFKDIQYHVMATDPPAFGVIGGVQIYYSTYADEEYLRWNAKLLRHYCIEGRTDRLSKDPYNLDHVRNPDFEHGIEGWSVSAAEPGSVGVKRMARYGSFQSRYPGPPSGMGDTFLWMKRSAKKPNAVSQEIGNLQAGRAYSMKMYVADYPELASDRKHVVSVTIDGADMIPEKCLRGSFRSIHYNYPREKHYVNFLRLVFRARAATAGLTISDWASEKEPGGPIGQELMYNFVEIEPYLMEDE